MQHPEVAPRSNHLKISVVVPVRDEANSVRALLESLLGQTLPAAEIVITDGGSKDATPEIVEEFISSGSPVRLIREQAALPGRGRNVAVANSACEWIAFTDAGNTPAKDWLANLAQKASEDAAVDIVYGSYQPVVDSFFKECAAIAYVFPPVDTAEGPVRDFSIVSALMRRKVWETVGGFPEHLRSAEDLLFIRKVEQAGFRITRAPKAIVHWDIQPNLWRTFKRFVTYARDNLRAGLWRQWQAAVFLRYGLILVAAVPAFVVGLRWLVVPLILWLGMMIARAVRALYRNRSCYPASHGRNLTRLLLLLPTIATLDAATFIGSINWAICDKLRLSGAKTNDGS